MLQYRDAYAISDMCAFFGISRAAYYAWVHRQAQGDPDWARLSLVQDAYRTSHQIYGYRRISAWVLQKRQVRINPKAVLRLMRKLGIRSIARRPRPYQKMVAGENDQRYPNLLQRDFSATQPNQKWVTDVTYIHTQQGWAYLATIQDLYDHFIVGYHFGRDHSVNLVTHTVRQAIQQVPVTDGLVLHSDQGQVYRSRAYHRVTQALHITPSMSRRGNCWDNAPIENFFGHLKEEALRHIQNPSFEQAQQAIDAYMQFYNYERIQLKTKQTPYQKRCLSL
jgi:transposase InsO family protein